MKRAWVALGAMAVAVGIAWWVTRPPRVEREPVRATGELALSETRARSEVERPEGSEIGQGTSFEEKPVEASPLVDPAGDGTRHRYDPEDPVQCVVYGRLLDDEGAPVTSPYAGLSFTNELAQSVRAKPDGEGHYSVSGLAPGAWWLAASSRGYRRTSEPLQLSTDRPVVRKDVRLIPSVIVKVRALTPEGAPLLRGLSDAGLPRRQILPIATAEHPGKRFYDVRGSLNNPFGVGQYFGNGYIFDRLPPEYLGVLVLDGDAPVYVSVVFHHVVLETQRLEAGEEEVEFVIAPAQIADQFATLKLRVVNAESRSPIAGTEALLEGAYYGQRPSTDDDGRLTIADREPGRYTLTLSHSVYERYRETIELEPGGVTDLGTIELGAATSIRGVVVTEDGSPAAVDLRLLRVDPETGELVNDRRRAKTDPMGAFSFEGLGRAEYVVCTYGDDQFWYGGQTETLWVSENVVARTFTGSVEDLTVPVVRPCFVSLVGPSEGWKGLRYVILDAGERMLRTRPFYGVEPQRLKLPPGSYRLRVTNEDGRVLEDRAFTAGTEPLILRSAPLLD